MIWFDLSAFVIGAHRFSNSDKNRSRMLAPDVGIQTLNARLSRAFWFAVAREHINTALSSLMLPHDDLVVMHLILYCALLVRPVVVKRLQ